MVSNIAKLMIELNQSFLILKNYLLAGSAVICGGYPDGSYFVNFDDDSLYRYIESSDSYDDLEHLTLNLMEELSFVDCVDEERHSFSSTYHLNDKGRKLLNLNNSVWYESDKYYEENYARWEEMRKTVSDIRDEADERWRIHIEGLLA